MNNQDERIIQMRKQVYQKYQSNFEDICFTLFVCPFCGHEKFDITLMPLVNKEDAGSSDLIAAHENLLSRIFKAEFDFLHEKFYCDCEQNGLYELKRIIYCYFHDGIDYHNYIDYPFEYIFTYKIYQSDQNKRLMFFDTETTGLPKNWKSSYKDTNNWPRLVQIAWIISDEKGNVISKNSFIIKPNNFIIPKEASEIHGITSEKAITEGEDIEMVLLLFKMTIGFCTQNKILTFVGKISHEFT